MTANDRAPSVQSAALRIRRAVVGDATALSAFAHRAFNATFAADNDPADMALYLAATLTVDRQERELQEPRRTCLLAEHDGTLVGYAYLLEGAPHDAVAATHPLELERFYVDHAWHGQGIAASLMVAVLEEARSRGGDALWLGVWERNARAIRFYDKCGFVTVGAQTFMLGRDAQRDAVMRRQL